MKITVEYFGQLGMIVGKKEEEKEFPDGITVKEIVGNIAEGHGADFTDIVLDENGSIRPSVMVVVNDEAVDTRRMVPPADGQTVKLIPAIAGG